MAGPSNLNYDQAAWTTTYLVFALLIVPGLVTSLVIREPDVAAPLPNEPSRYTFNHQLAAVGCCWYC